MIVSVQGRRARWSCAPAFEKPFENLSNSFEHTIKLAFFLQGTIFNTFCMVFISCPWFSVKQKKTQKFWTPCVFTVFRDFLWLVGCPDNRLWPPGHILMVLVLRAFEINQKHRGKKCPGKKMPWRKMPLRDLICFRKTFRKPFELFRTRHKI